MGGNREGDMGQLDHAQEARENHCFPTEQGCGKGLDLLLGQKSSPCKDLFTGDPTLCFHTQVA